MRASSLRRSLLAAALALAVAAPARAELRISDLAVFLNDHEVTVHVVLLGAVPEAFQEGIQSGIPAHVRVTVELWQYNRYWRDQRLMAKVVERPLVYNVVTKALKVTSLKGEARPVHITRDVDGPRLALEGRDLERLGHHVVDEGALDDLRHQPLVAPVAVVLPELDGDTDVRRYAALDPLLKRLGDGAEQHDVDRHLVVVEEDGEVADA